MCGFAGEFVFPPAGPADLDRARRMARAVAHRGPDQRGEFLSPDGRCAIGFHRLAVIDRAGSPQPMTSADGQLTVAFNGEIYNYRELRRRLREQGAAFDSEGDTEVLLHLYRRHAGKMVDHLDGMFAFAIYDAAEGRLLLARDRLGQKPLWYAALPDRLVFASEAGALLAHPGVDRTVDSCAIAFYMTLGYVPAPRSIWRGLAKLPPAHWLTVSDRPAAPERYWEPAVTPVPDSRSACIDDVRSRLAASVEARMRADVPLGALLSGGIDSSVIVALMARAAGGAGGIRTFTAGFESREYDERPAAKAVSEHIGTDHTELSVRAAPAAALDEVAGMYGEPFADSSALPTFLICQAARPHVTVALTGDGGDEVFGGYDRYRALHLGETMSPAKYLGVRLAAALARPFAPTAERSRLRRLIRFADGLPYPPAQQYFRYRRLFGPDGLERLFQAEFAENLDLSGPEDWFRDLYEEGELPDEAAYAQRHDLLTYLPDDLLVKADIASMAVGLELRCPMLEHRMVCTGLSLPVDAKIAGGRGKAILREAFADLIPREVLDAPKRGFGVPLARWLREDLAVVLQETLLDRSFLDRGIFRPEAVAGLINDHLRRRDDHSHRLWALLVLGRWFAGQQ